MKKYKSIITIIVMLIIICINNICYAETYSTQPNPKRDVVVGFIDGILRNSCHWNGENTITVEQDNTKYKMIYGDNKRYTVTFYITKITEGSFTGMYVGQINFEDKLASSTQNPASSTQNGSTNLELTDPITNPDYYAPTDTTGSNTKFIEKGNIVIGVMRTIGIVISVVALMVIGIRYMFGSIEERANYKETMIPYLIGAIMLFTITTVLGIIYDLVKAIQF